MGEKKHKDDDASPPAKKQPKIFDRYSPLNPAEITDENTHERHMKALKAELDRDRQRICAVLELMELTFCHRREFVLNCATSVEEILTMYPALHQPDVVSNDISLVNYYCMYIVDYPGDGTNSTKGEGLSGPTF